MSTKMEAATEAPLSRAPPSMMSETPQKPEIRTPKTTRPRAVLALETLVTTIGFALFVFWSVGHGSGFFLRDEEWMFNDGVNFLFNANATDNMKEYFYKHIVMYVFNEPDRLPLLRFHIITSAATGLMMLLQLNPAFRNRSFKRHRKIGYAISTLLIACVLPYIGYMMLWHGLDPLPGVIWKFDLAAACLIIGGFVGGMKAILVDKDVQRHRLMMMICAAGLWANAAQRFFWSFLTKANYTIKTGEEWVEGPLTQSCILGILFNLATALYFGLFTEMTEKDSKYARFLQKSKMAANPMKVYPTAQNGLEAKKLS